jgi:2-methylisocitrate lyase-like PEP mutase family enzyme
VTGDDRRERFRALHERPGLFVLANPWDAGSARLFAAVGFEALSTTSAGFAWTLGRNDQRVRRDEMVRHVAAVADATSLPVMVDSERLYPNDAGGVAGTVAALAAAGASGCSIEDYDPLGGRIDDVAQAAERVASAAQAARRFGLVLTARCENHLYAAGGIDDTIDRLRAYVSAGADVVYAPGLTDPAEIAALVAAVTVPVSVLVLPTGPAVSDLARLGVRRVSTGPFLASSAYAAAVASARLLLEQGDPAYASAGLSRADRAAAFASDG